MSYQNISPLMHLLLLLSCLNINCTFENKNIPIFDSVNFSVCDGTIANATCVTQTSNPSKIIINLMIHNVTYTSLKDILLCSKTVIPDFLSNNDEDSIEDKIKYREQIKQLFLFLKWMNTHIKEGVLYDNDMEIHGWIHQFIYAIEKLNVHFLYPLLCGCVVSLPQCYTFNENIVSKEILEKNEAFNYQFVFDEPDFFYAWLLFVTINTAHYNQLEGFILDSNILLKEKNSPTVLTFFEEIKDKYKDIVDGEHESNEQQLMFEKTEELIGNMPLLIHILETIIHQSPDINTLESPKIDVLYCDPKYIL